MKYKVTYTESAKKDLKSILGYISKKLLAPENAAGQTQRIMAAVRKLDTMPRRYKLYEEEPWYSQALRYFSIDNYLVFYKVNDEIGKVYVVRLMYGGRDIRTQLNKSQI